MQEKQNTSKSLQHTATIASVSSQKDIAPKKSMQFTAVLLAGARKPNDPVAAIFGKTYKALVPLVGRPMISYALEALKKAESIGKIIIVFDGQENLLNESELLKTELQNGDIEIISPAESICASIKKVLFETNSEWPFLVTTADHALLQAHIVDQFCKDASLHEGMSVGFVEKKCIEEVHPTSKRTYIPFKDTKLSGANLFSFMTKDVGDLLDFWVAFESKRKTPWRLFQAFGFFNLVSLMLRQYDVKSAFERASKRLGVSAHAITIPHAEAAIDVDSPQDYMQVTKILEERAATRSIIT